MRSAPALSLLIGSDRSRGARSDGWGASQNRIDDCDKFSLVAGLAIAVARVSAREALADDRVSGRGPPPAALGTTRPAHDLDM